MFIPTQEFNQKAILHYLNEGQSYYDFLLRERDKREIGLDSYAIFDASVKAIEEYKRLKKKE